MGNRAVLHFPEYRLNVYLHWNGGRESVAAFLQYAQEVGVRTDSYYVPRLCQIIGNFFGGTTSIGLDSGMPYSPGDNGIYTITLSDQMTVIDHNGRRQLLSEFVESVSHSAYWANGEGRTSIMDQLRAKNDPHFKPEAAKAAA